MNDPTMRDVPIGLSATGTRKEFDSMGPVDVLAGRYHAYGTAKKACALVNRAEGRLPQ